MSMSKEEIYKLNDKIILNGFYPLLANDKFYLYDEKIAVNITIDGKKLIKTIINHESNTK